MKKDRIELDQRWRDTIAQVVRDGQAAGEIGRSVDADDFAITFSALLDGLSIQVALEDPVVDPEPGLRDRDGLRGQGPRRRLAAAPDDRVRPGARSLTPAGRAEPRWRRRPRHSPVSSRAASGGKLARTARPVTNGDDIGSPVLGTATSRVCPSASRTTTCVAGPR